MSTQHNKSEDKPTLVPNTDAYDSKEGTRGNNPYNHPKPVDVPPVAGPRATNENQTDRWNNEGGAKKSNDAKTGDESGAKGKQPQSGAAQGSSTAIPNSSVGGMTDGSKETTATGPTKAQEAGTRHSGHPVDGKQKSTDGRTDPVAETKDNAESEKDRKNDKSSDVGAMRGPQFKP